MTIESCTEKNERQWTHGLTDLEVYEAVEGAGDDAWGDLQRMDVRIGDEIFTMDGAALVGEVVRGSDGYPCLRLTRDGKELYELVKAKNPKIEQDDLEHGEFYRQYFNKTAQQRFLAAQKQIELDAANRLSAFEEFLKMSRSIRSFDPPDHSLPACETPVQ